MKLDAFFAAVKPLWLGTAEVAATVEKLGGAVDGKRLALYAQFCDAHRNSVVSGIYSVTQGHVEKQSWRALVEKYFAQHPALEWELNGNAPEFVAFLRAQPGLPSWLWELADVEWWHFAAFVAADEPVERGEKDSLHPTLMLRPYSYDVLRAYEEEKTEPVLGSCVMRIHRDGGLAIRSALATPAELAVIKAVVEDVTLKDAAEASGIMLAQLKQARTALIEEDALVERRRKGRN